MSVKYNLYCPYAYIKIAYIIDGIFFEMLFSIFVCNWNLSQTFALIFEPKRLSSSFRLVVGITLFVRQNELFSSIMK